jgi:hypothetical protein
MKKSDQGDDMRPEYDFAAMQGGVRGKHVRRLGEQGANVVLLDPDVAEAFPSEASVNEALRGVLNTTRAVKRSGGLPNPNKALQPTSRASKPTMPRKTSRATRG